MEMKVDNVNPAGESVSKEDNNESNSPEKETKSEPIRNEEYLNKVLKERNNYREAFIKAEEEKKRLVENELKQKEDYKSIAERKELEANEWRSKFEEREQMIVQSRKVSAIKKELTKLGCSAKSLDRVATKLVDLNGLTYDDATGTVTGQLEAAKAVQEEFTELFGSTNVGVNQSAPAGTPDNLTIEAYKKMPYEERRKHKEKLYENLGVNRRR